jgi:uncharacterized protein with GYD domain
MHRYITLLKFTPQGARAIKSPKRERLFAKVAEQAGIKIEGQYWTRGPYDGVLVISAKNETDAMRLPVALAAAGNLEIRTMEEILNPTFELTLLEQHAKAA